MTAIGNVTVMVMMESCGGGGGVVGREIGIDVHLRERERALVAGKIEHASLSGYGRYECVSMCL
jgi:hypothetical protein